MQTAMKHFDGKTNIERRQLIKAVIPEIIVHPGNKIELRIVADPAGSSRCHTGEQKVLVGENGGSEWTSLELGVGAKQQHLLII